MKTLIIAASLLVILSAGCKKDRFGGEMSVKMTDAPALYSQVNVDIRSVEVQYESGTEGWLALKTNAGIYNLLALQNDVTVVIADKGDLPVGKVAQMRLLLGEKNSLVLLDGSSADLKVSSGMETGVKINLDATIKAGSHTQVVLDFDAEKSIVVEGNGSFILKPVIQVESITQINSRIK